MKSRTTVLLMALFFVAMIGLWWARFAEVRTATDRARDAGFVLPELRGVDPASIRVIEIDGGEGPILLERDATRGWSLTGPVRAGADAALVESALGRLLDLTRYGDAAPIAEADPTRFGFGTATRSIRLFADDPEEAVATLELGARVDDRRYVRRKGDATIEVVAADALAPFDLPTDAWRERALFGLAPYDVAGVEVTSSDRDLKLVAIGDRWAIERPLRAPADAAVVNQLLADLAGLRAVAGPSGFPADEAADLAVYGLDPPRLTIRLTPAGEVGTGPDRAPRTAEVGVPVPGRPDAFYARRAGSDEVMVVHAPAIDTLGLDPTALRSRRVLDLPPEDFRALRIRVGDTTHSLARVGADWAILGPAPGPADAPIVGELLSVLGALETADFLPPDPARDAQLDPPAAEIEVWSGPQVDGTGPAQRSLPERPPDAALGLGPYLASIQGRYARLAGDSTAVLLLPRTLDQVLPTGPLALRDRTIAADDPRSVARIRIARAGASVVVQTADGGASWRISEPVPAPADALIVRTMAVVLARLRADRLIDEAPTADDLARVGLGDSATALSWTVASPRPPATTRTLRLGAAVPGTEGGRYARLEGSPALFTLASQVVAALAAEPRQKQILEMDPRALVRLEIATPDRTATATRRDPTTTAPRVGTPGWTIDPAGAIAGLDAPACEALATSLAGLTAQVFVQYGGPIAPGLGLARPRLKITGQAADGTRTQALRIGPPTADGSTLATLGDGASGAVFTLPSAPFAFAAEAGTPAVLPDDPFAR